MVIEKEWEKILKWAEKEAEQWREEKIKEILKKPDNQRTGIERRYLEIWLRLIEK